MTTGAAHKVRTPSAKINNHMPERAAIYARISQDDGTALGVQRQEDDCRKLADTLGWTVADVYIDNDVSAYSGKRRKEYERMLANVKDGQHDGILCYNVDRLTRNPKDIVRFLDVVGPAGIDNHVRFVSGVQGIAGDDRTMLWIMAAMAEKESADKSRRVRSKMDDNALKGKLHGGHRRYGWQADRKTLKPDEVDIVRGVVTRVLAGQSLYAIATELNEAGVPTRGNYRRNHETGQTDIIPSEWRLSTLHDMLLSPRIAGLREHHGELVRDESGQPVQGEWEPIISVAEWESVKRAIQSRSTSGRRSPRRYLLSGMLRCGKCGNTLFSAARKDERRYVCVSGPDHGGCGGVMVNAQHVEDLVAARVLRALNSEWLTARISGRYAENERLNGLEDTLVADQGQLQELAKAYGQKLVTLSEWLTARRPIEERIDRTRRQLNRSSGMGPITQYMGNGTELTERWDSMPLGERVAIVQSLVDHVAIMPAHAAGRGQWNPARVSEPVWRI